MVWHPSDEPPEDTDEGDEQESTQDLLDQHQKEGAERNLKMLDRLSKTVVESDKELWPARLAKDQATALEIISEALSLDDQEETIEMDAHQLWQWCSVYGIDNLHLLESLRKSELEAITLQSEGDMKSYLEAKRNAWRKLCSADETSVLEAKLLDMCLDHLGREGMLDRVSGKQGKFYQVKRDLRKEMRDPTRPAMTWKRFKSALLLDAEEEAAEQKKSAPTNGTPKDPEDESNSDAEPTAKEETVNILKEMKQAIVMLTKRGQQPSRQRQQQLCYNCDRPGHMARDCRQRPRQRDYYGRGGGRRGGYNNGGYDNGGGRYNGGGRGRGRGARDGDRDQERQERPDEAVETDEGDLFFCVDGASETHLICSPSLFHRMTNVIFVEDESVLMNTFPSKIIARGDLALYVKGNKIPLTNVAYVPESSHNLISVSRLLDSQGGFVCHSKRHVMFTPEHGRYKIWGKRKGGLYYFLMSQTNMPVGDGRERPVVLGPTTEDTATTDLPAFRKAKAWAIDYMAKQHNRMHVGLRTLKEVMKRDKVERKLTKGQLSWLTNVTKDELPTECCDASKVRRKNPKGRKPEKWRRDLEKKRQNGGTTETKASTETDLRSHQNTMTVDTAGPNPRSLQGNRNMFVATFSDDKNVALGFGKHKDDAENFIIENYPTWCNEQERKPTILKSDRGGEYNNERLNKWTKQNGIKQKFTAPHSSAGSAEKKIGTIQDIERAMRHWAQCPESFWEESSKYAATITQFVPSRAEGMKGLSPWEKRHKSKPRMDALRRWGCLMHTWVSDKQRKRLENRGRPAMFVGLADTGENDGVRAYDASTKTFFHAKVAEFDEEKPYFAWWKERQERERQLKESVRQELRLEAITTKDNDRIKELRKNPPLAVNNSYHALAPEKQEEEHDVDVEEEEEAKEEQVFSPEQTDRRSGRKREQRGIFDPSSWEEQFKTDRVNVTSMVSRLNMKAHKTRNARPQHWKKKSIVPKRPRYDQDNPLPHGMIPKTVNEALTGIDKEEWKGSMADERKSLREKEVFQEIHSRKVPKGRQLIRAKWVFDIKRNAAGEIVRYKARLVAKGYLQVEGRDYGADGLFAPTPALTSIRLIIPIALRLGFKVHHQDVKTAFLNAKLEKKYRQYMIPPEGFKATPGHVLELLKCLYGLKQSSHEWNQEIDKTLRKYGFRNIAGDECVYVHHSPSGKIDCILGVHVDDIIIAAPEKRMAKVKEMLKASYIMSDLGELSWYLGIKFEWSPNRQSCTLSQQAMIQEILEEHGMSECNAKKVPARKEFMRKPETPMTDQEIQWLNDRDLSQTKYRSLVGALQYLALATRPDIAFATGQLARFVQDPRRQQWLAAKQLLGYLSSTRSLVLKFKIGEDRIIGWVDADWAGNLDDRSSTSGYTFIIGGGAISWKSKKQSAPARSSAEAEIMALDLAVREARWLRKLAKDLQMDTQPTTIHEDNSAAIAISAKHRRTPRTKHIDVQYFAVSDDIKRGLVEVKPVASEDNVADIFTKGLEKTKFEKFRNMLGLVEPSTVRGGA